MAFELRPYQRAAVDAAIAHVKKSLAPCLLELCTGAGKSALVSEIARFFAEVAPSKRILCIAPSRELVMQNHYRYTVDYGYPATSAKNLAISDTSADLPAPVQSSSRHGARLFLTCAIAASTAARWYGRSSKAIIRPPLASHCVSPSLVGFCSLHRSVV